NAAAISRCTMCDPYGYRDGTLCSHDPTQPGRATAGAAMARAAISPRTPASRQPQPATRPGDTR
ncbi:MAG TPA: hypothetical protein VIQ30_20065, partial [Pseudonocardia sp.]